VVGSRQPRGELGHFSHVSMQLTSAQAYTGVKVGLLDKGENPVIMIPHSNAIDVKVDV